MEKRHQLQALLEGLLGSENVYFQPPPNTAMQYPCIVYERNNATNVFANNASYRYTKRYTVTVIDSDPDSETPDKIAKLPLCTYERRFATQGLNHDVFNLYF